MNTDLMRENEDIQDARLNLADALRRAVLERGRWDDVAREVERLIEAKIDQQLDHTK